MAVGMHFDIFCPLEELYLYFCKGVKGRELLFIEPLVCHAL